MTQPLPVDSMQRISALHRWTLNPTDMKDLTTLLGALSNEELVYVTYVFGTDGAPVARIAWVEYARRKKYFDFEVKMIPISSKELRLVFEAQGAPIHTNPILDIKVPS